MVMNGLLELLKEAGNYTLGDTEDLNIIAQEKFITTVREHMLLPLNVFQYWTERKGISLSSSKPTIVPRLFYGRFKN